MCLRVLMWGPRLIRCAFGTHEHDERLRHLRAATGGPTCLGGAQSGGPDLTRLPTVIGTTISYSYPH